MTLPQAAIEATYSYAEYLHWNDQERWELINGDIWDMSPAPSRLHQEISIRLSSVLYQHFKQKDCAVYAAPFDVRLPEQEDAEDEAVTTVVQPDISVICDQNKLDERGCIGAPDLIVEILFPATAAKDLKVKRDLYEQHGVKEYWLFHPTDHTVMVYRLGADNQYGKAEIFTKDDLLRSRLCAELEIELAAIFPKA
ncbi:MAG: Uma2 family endonuclease [Candidatus Electrothrix aestuarii]|uniref:Uma2 family endonuclease n=1 Tax=Candidatus Electrothrix aestuarii TaxID=3062594 RepID=A0AAU8M1K8_9BACT|nr:Uma2 family endonuclease [Candidatus Electrothrix aestuarii]